MAIWQDLVDDQGFPGRYNSVKRFVRELRGVTTPEARIVIETAPGEESLVYNYASDQGNERHDEEVGNVLQRFLNRPSLIDRTAATAWWRLHA